MDYNTWIFKFSVFVLRIVCKQLYNICGLIMEHDNLKKNEKASIYIMMLPVCKSLKSNWCLHSLKIPSTSHDLLWIGTVDFYRKLEELDIVYDVNPGKWAG